MGRRGSCFCLLVLLCFGLLWPGQMHGQVGNELTEIHRKERILILLDASAGMNAPRDRSATHYEAASALIKALLDSLYTIDKQVEFGLRVSGHQFPARENNCYDSKLEVAFSEDNRVQMELRLKSMRPQGLSTVSFALNEAITKDIIELTGADYQVILITGGLESCSKDICPMAVALKQRTGREPFVIGLSAGKGLETAYGCLGRYLQAYSEQETPKVLKPILDLYRRVNASIPPAIQEEGGYIRLLNLDELSDVWLLFRTGDSFFLIPRSPDGTRQIVSGKIKLKAGRYKIVYTKGNAEEKALELTVRNGKLTEVEAR